MISRFIQVGGASLGLRQIRPHAWFDNGMDWNVKVTQRHNPEILFIHQYRMVPRSHLQNSFTLNLSFKLCRSSQHVCSSHQEHPSPLLCSRVLVPFLCCLS